MKEMEKYEKCYEKTQVTLPRNQRGPLLPVRVIIKKKKSPWLQIFSILIWMNESF